MSIRCKNSVSGCASEPTENTQFTLLRYLFKLAFDAYLILIWIYMTGKIPDLKNYYFKLFVFCMKSFEVQLKRFVNRSIKCN